RAACRAGGRRACVPRRVPGTSGAAEPITLAAGNSLATFARAAAASAASKGLPPIASSCLRKYGLSLVRKARDLGQPVEMSLPYLERARHSSGIGRDIATAAERVR